MTFPAKTYADSKANAKKTIEVAFQRHREVITTAAGELVYFVGMAFCFAIQIALLYRQSPDSFFGNVTKSHRKKRNRSKPDDRYILVYYFDYAALVDCLDRVKQKQNILAHWPQGNTPIRFCGVGGFSNLDVALDFSRCIYSLCHNSILEEMDMDSHIVFDPGINQAAQYIYNMAMYSLSEELPPESEWSRTRIKEESDCILSLIPSELELYEKEVASGDFPHQISKDLTDTEQNILEALGKETLMGKDLLKKAGYDFSSHYRAILSNLVKRGILNHISRKGYQNPR